MHRERRAAHHHGLQLVAAGDAAADVVDQVAHGDPVRSLVDAGPLDVAGEAEESRCRSSQAGTPICANSSAPTARIGRDRRDRLDVVDQRRRGVEALDRRERRLRAAAGRACPRATRAGRSPRRRCTRRRRGGSRSSTSPSSPASRASSSAAWSTSYSAAVLAADVDVDVLRLDRVRRDEAALDQAVRDLQHDLAVLEGPGLRLVGVDGEVDRLRDLVRVGMKLALRPVGKKAPPRPRRFDSISSWITRLGILRARLLELRRSRRPRGTRRGCVNGSPS